MEHHSLPRKFAGSKYDKSEQNNKNLCPHGAYTVVRGVLRVEYSLLGCCQTLRMHSGNFLSNYWPLNESTILSLSEVMVLH